jgi:hypothetical protein
MFWAKVTKRRKMKKKKNIYELLFFQIDIHKNIYGVVEL